MDKLSGLGRMLLISGVLGFAVQALICAAPVPGLEPIPPSLPGRMLLANATGVLLAVLAGGMLWPKARRQAALGLALLSLAWIVLLHAPVLAADPSSGGAWSHAFMAVALAGAALGMSGRLPPLGRVAYGLALIVFGAVHLIYHDAISAMIPAWIPGRAAWPYLTGPVQVIAGIAVASGIGARPAAAMIGLVFASWIVLLHIPAVAAAPAAAGEWNRLFIALALAGGAWTLVSRLRDSQAIEAGSDEPRNRSAH